MDSHGFICLVCGSQRYCINVQTQMEAPMAIFKAASSVIYPHLLRFLKVQRHHHQAASHHLPIWVFTNRPHQCIHIKVTLDSRFNPSLFGSFHPCIHLQHCANIRTPKWHDHEVCLFSSALPYLVPKRGVYYGADVEMYLKNFDDYCKPCTLTGISCTQIHTTSSSWFNSSGYCSWCSGQDK